MKESNREHEIMKKVMSDLPLEKPSPDFVKGVMDKIALQQAQQFNYKPLISWKGWVLIAIGVLVSCISVFNYSIPESVVDTSALNGFTSAVKSWAFPTLFPNLEIPNLFILTFALCGVFMLVQIKFIKDFASSRYAA